VPELERREARRADGRVEGRPAGLARRSNELCHGHGLDYDVHVRTDQHTTAESVDAIIAALHAANLLGPRHWARWVWWRLWACWRTSVGDQPIAESKMATSARLPMREATAWCSGCEL